MRRRNFIAGMMGAIGLAPLVAKNGQTLDVTIAEGQVNAVSNVMVDGRAWPVEEVFYHYESKTGMRLCDARIVIGSNRQ